MARHMHNKSTVLQRIVLDYDFGEASALALQYAAFLAEQAHITELHVVTVLDQELVRHGVIGAVDREGADQVRRLAREAVDQRLDPARANHVCVYTHAPRGYADEEVLRVAREVDAELIIIGIDDGRRKYLSPSFAEVIARRAGCPVFVTRPIDHDRSETSPHPPGQPAGEVDKHN